MLRRLRQHADNSAEAAARQAVSRQARPGPIHIRQSAYARSECQATACDVAKASRILTGRRPRVRLGPSAYPRLPASKPFAPMICLMPSANARAIPPGPDDFTLFRRAAVPEALPRRARLVEASLSSGGQVVKMLRYRLASRNAFGGAIGSRRYVNGDICNIDAVATRDYSVNRRTPFSLPSRRGIQSSRRL